MVFVSGTAICVASWCIQQGSEWLLLLSTAPALVGGLLIPVLGALPDALIMVMSKERVEVAVGALAGSTIFTLTLPWAAIVYLGDPTPGKRQGVTTTTDVPVLARIMIGTGVLFMLVQIPAWFFGGRRDAFQRESSFDLIAFILTLLAFFVYIVFQLYDSRISNVREHRQREIKKRSWRRIAMVSGGLIGIHSITREQLGSSLFAMGIRADRKDLLELISLFNSNFGVERNSISGEEFEHLLLEWLDIVSDSQQQEAKGVYFVQVELEDLEDHGPTRPLISHDAVDFNGAEPNPHNASSTLNLTDRYILTRAFVYMVVAALLMAYFSGSLVESVSSVAQAIHISSFYVSFLLIPLVSTLSEVLTGLSFARKQTRDGVSLGYSRFITPHSDLCLASILFTDLLI